MAQHKRSESSDLNRPLPTVPSDGPSHTPSAGDTTSSSFADNLNNRLADPHNRSTPYIDKQTYRRLTKDILAPPTPSSPSLSFQERGMYYCVDPVKYNPSTSSKYSDDMTGETSSLTPLNPFRDNERYTRIEDLYDSRNQDAMAKAAHNMYAGAGGKPQSKAAGMSHSFSDSSMHYHNTQSNMSSPQLSGLFDTQGFSYIRFADENDPPLLPPESPRGRPVRTPSPVKQLEDIREEVSLSPKSPPKRSRSPVKQLFGEKGWLGRSTSMKELPSEEYRKTGLKIWGGKLKQKMIAKTEDLSKIIPSTFAVHASPSKPPKERETTRFPVTMKPPEQCKLYSEIELMICATANQYLNNEKEALRMSLESVQKITAFWLQKCRPQVIEFQFDQATQRDLVESNVKTFRFYGPSAEDPMAMHSMLQRWKVLAKEMTVRTFCSPDSVIRKHMHDTYKILEMLGAPMVTFLAFQELQIDALGKLDTRQRLLREHQGKRFGVEMRWEPPVGGTLKRSGEGWENPFE